MLVLDTPLRLTELLQKREGVLAGAEPARYDIADLFLKRIATLKELAACQSVSAGIEREFSLAFATSVSGELGRLEKTVLVAPLDLGDDHVLLATLRESNIVVMVDNPRLEFIRLANQVFEHLHRDGSRNEGFLNPVSFGDNCIVKDGAVIGKPGFGFERDSDGTPIRFPHFGRVLIGDNVEIGANSVISRGTIEDTVIGDSSKIDDLVYIAHNCKVGKSVMIAGNATLCGGVSISDSAWIGAGASIKQNLTIGEGATVGMGAVVTKDVPAYSTVVGNPARMIRNRTQSQGAS